MVIQIQISDKQWKALNSLKRRGETFQQVLDRLLFKDLPEIKTAYELQNER